ncbi:MAG: biotin--[acetyl-CoA-carboxylase] ligase [Chlamydiia bacterium]|nr:biotin--[acetyl-CoA-carboxylase] ligase [Chlamydiia bacterium]
MREIRLDIIDSTNAYAKAHASQWTGSEIVCITAEEQTAGKGRQNRPWLSPRGVNLYVTFFFELSLSQPHVSCLSHIGALSVAEVLEEQGVSSRLKWPNDIWLNGKKTGGILCETIVGRTTIQVVLGIGLNVNMGQEYLAAIDQSASSLMLETGKVWDKEVLLQQLQTRFVDNLEEFRERGFAPFHERFQERMLYRGEMVSLSDEGKKWVGICEGVSADGRLVLYERNNREKRLLFNTGKISPLGK